MRLVMICPEMTGHLNPMTTLGVELVRSGHEVFIVGSPKLKEDGRWPELKRIVFGIPEAESGRVEVLTKRLGELRGLAAVNVTAALLHISTNALLRDLPSQLVDGQFDGIIVDQVAPAGISIAQALGIPFVFVCNALAFNLDASVPPCIFPWRYSSSTFGRLRNRLGNQVLSFAGSGLYRTLNSYRARHGLKPTNILHREFGELLTVAQQPSFFDFPRENLPEHFHYTGPWHATNRDKAIDFPWDKLDGRPVVFASLGTLQNRNDRLFQAIADAFAGSQYQLVMSLGRRDGVWNRPLPDGAIVVPYAPQLEILKRCVAVVTHAGLNTSMEALANGLPMVAIPITNDQPGVARRLELLGLARIILPQRATKHRIRAAVDRILTDDNYKKSALTYQAKIASAAGVSDAAQLIEEAFSKKQKITRNKQNNLTFLSADRKD